MWLLSAEESRRLDRLSNEKHGVTFWSLMTRAGQGVAQALLERWPEATPEGGVLVVAGRGNNGGDGLVAAHYLLLRRIKVSVLLLGRIEALRGDAARACSQFVGDGGRVVEIVTETALRAEFAAPRACVIDAIFGTGLNAPVEGLAAAAVNLINASGVPIVAVDIPSGVNADSGAVMGRAVKAALTVTFGAAKYGHVSYPGAGLVGELRVIDIGFAPAALTEIAPRGRFVQAEELRPLLMPRPDDSHKGMFGHPLIIAGAMGKSGAALLASRGALRAGAGLVTAAIPQSIAPLVAAGQAELMTEPMPETDGHFAAAATQRLRQVLEHKSAIVIGPGIGVSSDTRALVEFLAGEGCSPSRPLLIDADGLNALAEIGCERLRIARGPVVLTPHPGEAARLLGTSTVVVNANRIDAARRICERSGAYCLLKGARTVLASPDGVVYINSTGNPGMGTPGMGDALSGIVGALLSQGLAPMDALALGAFLHGAAADRVAARIGAVGYITSDLIDELPATRAALG